VFDAWNVMEYIHEQNAIELAVNRFQSKWGKLYVRERVVLFGQIDALGAHVNPEHVERTLAAYFLVQRPNATTHVQYATTSWQVRLQTVPIQHQLGAVPA
jgi:hypothetical protein